MTGFYTRVTLALNGLNNRKHKTESVERKIKKKIILKITVQTYFISIEALLGKCDLLSEDDKDFREKGEEFLILTGSKNQ